MKNDNSIVSSSKENKTDCFAWISKSKCNALNSKACKNCSFYKHFSKELNYSKYISKKDLLERSKNR